MSESPSGQARVVALLGAESTGKTTLAAALRDAFASSGFETALVGEYLREFCAREGRTPRREEQWPIAAEQARRIEAARAGADVVVVDTTALQIAVYSEMVFADRSLYAEARALQRRIDVTLLTALDVTWQADGLQRDGPHVREPVDRLLRHALDGAGVPYAVVCGLGEERVANALAAARAGLRIEPVAASASDARVPPGSATALSASTITEDAPSGERTAWRTVCERCGDADCERHLLATGRAQRKDRHGR